ncbi:MAG: response regulator transcription factor [Planctomycetota bacterium]|nr:response regulator transcription factor [Planctomycetota bacterium]
MRVLVVEDYQVVRDAISQSLREEGFVTDDAADGLQAAALWSGGEYDVIVLDVMLPGISGMDLVARMRESGDITPVLMLTALDGVEDRIKGLNRGADDYLAKPFAIGELVARVRALARRAYGRRTPVINVGPLVVDTAAQSATVNGRAITLTAREYSLLEYLALREGQVVTRDEICRHIYQEPQKESNVVDVYVGYLRKKLEGEDGPRLVHTRRGVGYLLTHLEESAG